MKEAVHNLLVNSIKYAEDDADSFCIHIGMNETPDAVTYYFHDWGIGIDEASCVPHVFDDNYRGREAQKRELGVGVGLSIARKAIQDCGGELTLKQNGTPGSRPRSRLCFPQPSGKLPHDPTLYNPLDRRPTRVDGK